MDKAVMRVFRKEWLKGGSLDSIAKTMLTGRGLKDYKAEPPVICTMGDMPADKPVALLDFGCGLGRGLYHIARRFPKWRVVGYDNQQMIDRIPDVWRDELPQNVEFTAEWDAACSMACRYPPENNKDGMVVIYCDLVLQHLEFDTLRAVMSEFRKLVERRGGGLIVHGRRCLDDMRTQVWPVILEHFSLDWIHGPQTLQSLYGGDPNEHIVAVFMTKILD